MLSRDKPAQRVCCGCATGLMGLLFVCSQLHDGGQHFIGLLWTVFVLWGNASRMHA
jgi:hypothetical protein